MQEPEYSQGKLADTIKHYEAVLASKDLMLSKYVKALEEKNNTIKSLKTRLAFFEQEVITLKEEKDLKLLFQCLVQFLR